MYEIHETLKETLLEEAAEAMENAYAPRSGYHVGVAVLAEDGEIYTGCNVESRPTTNILHAEARAIGKAAEAGNEGILALAMELSGDTKVPPCGNCRQKIASFKPDDGESDVLVLVGTENGYDEYTIDYLLPHAYTGQR